ncbi:hypothetical protein [Cerasicoccus frondis]|uniref:hypothetical protein n=1 Tax=Cerasicoccus frondis TaxID=490090 RepID=UPI00285266D1|nr:hypothetical protein [Cerasicoccus frondis]
MKLSFYFHFLALISACSLAAQGADSGAMRSIEGSQSPASARMAEVENELNDYQWLSNDHSHLRQSMRAMTPEVRRATMIRWERQNWEALKEVSILQKEAAQLSRGSLKVDREFVAQLLPEDADAVTQDYVELSNELDFALFQGKQLASTCVAPNERRAVLHQHSFEIEQKLIALREVKLPELSVVEEPSIEDLLELPLSVQGLAEQEPEYIQERTVFNQWIRENYQFATPQQRREAIFQAEVELEYIDQDQQ